MINKKVKLEVFLDEEIALWLDLVKKKVGLKDCSELINQMLKEVKDGSKDL